MEWCSKLKPNHPYVVNNLAYLYILLKKNKEASELCSEAYNLNHRLNNYFRNWAIALMNLKLYSEAVEVIRNAILSDSTSSSIIY